MTGWWEARMIIESDDDCKMIAFSSLSREIKENWETVKLFWLFLMLNDKKLLKYVEFFGFSWINESNGRGKCHQVYPTLGCACNGPLPGARILSAGRIIEVNLKSIKYTTVNKSLTGDDESVSHLRKRAQSHRRDSERRDIWKISAPLSAVLRNVPSTRLTSRSTFFFCRSHGCEVGQQCRELVQIVEKHRRDQTFCWSLLFRMSLKTWKFLLYEILLLRHTCDDRLFRNRHRYRFRTVL